MADPKRLKSHEKDAIDDLLDSLTKDNDTSYAERPLDDDEDDLEAIAEQRIRDISLTRDEDEQASVLALEAELAREQQGSVDQGFDRATITRSRVYPLGNLVPLKQFDNGTWNDPWKSGRFDKKWEHAHLTDETPRWCPGSITCIVQKSNDPDRYILTVGHAFYDIDLHRTTAARYMPGSNTKRTNRLDYAWGEYNLVTLAKLGPFADSEGEYYRMGDKFGSKVDCGLARLRTHDRTGARVVWSNVYVIDAQRQKRLVGLDVWPPPAEVKRLLFHWWEKPIDEFIVCSYIECTFTNHEGKHVSELEKVLIRPRDFIFVGTRQEYHYNGSPVQSGASGSAIIREVPGTSDAYVVGLALGFCTITQAKGIDNMFIALDPTITYDIFQHVSVAQAKLGLSQNLPQPEQ